MTARPASIADVLQSDICHAINSAESIVGLCGWAESLHTAVACLLKDSDADRVVVERVAQVGAHIGARAWSAAIDLRDQLKRADAAQKAGAAR